MTPPVQNARRCTHCTVPPAWDTASNRKGERETDWSMAPPIRGYQVQLRHKKGSVLLRKTFLGIFSEHLCGETCRVCLSPMLTKYSLLLPGTHSWPGPLEKKRHLRCQPPAERRWGELKYTDPHQPCRRPELSSRLLALAMPSPRCCGHLGSGSAVSLCLSVYLMPIPFCPK